MSKYIDADKLIAEIEKRQEYLGDHNFHSMASEYDWLLTMVQSLQQEQPEVEFNNSEVMSLEEAIQHCREKSCGTSACNLEHQQLAGWLEELKQRREQKQPGVDLEKEFNDLILKVYHECGIPMSR